MVHQWNICITHFHNVFFLNPEVDDMAIAIAMIYDLKINLILEKRSMFDRSSGISMRHLYNVFPSLHFFESWCWWYGGCNSTAIWLEKQTFFSNATCKFLVGWTSIDDCLPWLFFPKQVLQRCMGRNCPLLRCHWQHLFQKSHNKTTRANLDPPLLKNSLNV